MLNLLTDKLTSLRFHQEREVEEMEIKKIDTLDRHELTKLLEENGYQALDVDTLDQVRDDVKRLVREGIITL